MEKESCSTTEKDILERYKTEKTHIQERLKEFKTITKENQFNEFLFCLLTPQNNAQKCWEAVEQLKKNEKVIGDIHRASYFVK